jgi:ribonucleotide reductase beta subunit family protein with ferritin-like domain
LTTFMMDHAVTFFCDWVITASSSSFSFAFNASFYDEVKEKERRNKKNVECLNIFSTHNMLFHFISYVRNVIVVEGQYFSRIFHFFFNFGFLNNMRVYSQSIHIYSLCRVNVRKKTKRRK